MADNVKVKGSTDANAVNVATDEIGSIHYPVYKTAYGADGSVTQVDATNPLPVTMDTGQTEGAGTVTKTLDDSASTLLNGILKELKIMNLHLTMMTDNEISKSEIE